MACHAKKFRNLPVLCAEIYFSPGGEAGGGGKGGLNGRPRPHLELSFIRIRV